VIGLVMETLSPAAAEDGFMAQVVSGVEVGLRDAGMRMVLHLYRPGDDPLAELRSLVGRDLDGLVVANGGDVDDAVLDRIAATGTPTVLIENYRDGGGHAVVADNFSAGLRATEHLLSLGHRRIGMLVGSPRYVSLTDRRRGYAAALVEAGLAPDPALMPAQPSGTTRKGYAQMRSLLALPEPPTAVYAVSDKSAMGAYAAVAEAGLAIPDDLSIVGTDDVVDSAYLTPPLTTFRVPTADLGRAAARTMRALLGNDPPPPSRTVLPGRLVIRGSTGPAATS
jgi:LacI family transcriptional regulator